MTISAYELSEVDRLIAGKPALPPERIFGWLHTQLSVARFYGGCHFQGHEYKIALEEEGQPLVRADVLKREKKRKDVGKPDKLEAMKAQKVMF